MGKAMTSTSGRAEQAASPTQNRQGIFSPSLRTLPRTVPTKAWVKAEAIKSVQRFRRGRTPSLGIQHLPTLVDLFDEVLSVPLPKLRHFVVLALDDPGGGLGKLAEEQFHLLGLGRPVAGELFTRAEMYDRMGVD